MSLLAVHGHFNVTFGRTISLVEVLELACWVGLDRGSAFMPANWANFAILVLEVRCK